VVLKVIETAQYWIVYVMFYAIPWGLGMINGFVAILIPWLVYFLLSPIFVPYFVFSGFYLSYCKRTYWDVDFAYN